MTSFRRSGSLFGPSHFQESMDQQFLRALGGDDERGEELVRRSSAGPWGRVVRVDRTSVSILTNIGDERVEQPTSADPLVVGDWIALVEGVPMPLARRTELVRRVGAYRDQRQSMAANIDIVLIVRALDVPLRLNRLSTLVVMAYDSGATPLVVLTKADLYDGDEDICALVRSGLGGVDALAVSTTTGEGVSELRQRIDGHTIILLGESGAGKSTLTNELCGHEQLSTAEVRRDGQGRHTTTHRELVIIPTGGVVIDTPGIREAASFGSGEGVELAFHDVAALIEACEFNDCDHVQTSGCAVRGALASGAIEQARVDAYFHERREQQWLDNRLESRDRTATKKKLREQRAKIRKRDDRPQRDDG